MESGSVIKAFLCLFVTIHLEKVIAASKFDDIPFELLRRTVALVKTQQSQPSGTVGEAVLLLCGVFSGFQPRPHYTLRAWSPLRGLGQPTRDRKTQSSPEAAVQWTFDHVSDSVLRIHETARSLFRKKWPARCSFFLVTGRCDSQGQVDGCWNLHQYATSNSYKSFLGDILETNGILCEMTPLYYRRVIPEEVSKNFLSARRYWVETLLRGLTFVSAFEQDSAVTREMSRAICVEVSLRSVLSCLEENLLYKARDEWKSQASLGYVFEQMDSASIFSDKLRALLVGKTRRLLQTHHAPTYAAMVRSEQLQAQLRSGDALAYSNALQAFLSNQGGIMALPQQHFAVFHCYTARFESIAFYLMLQTSQSSVLIPHSWLDLHLHDILSLNKLSTLPSFDQRSVYRDALVFLIKAFVELLTWIDNNLQPGQSFVVCGRGYHTRLLQQRNAELLALILVNFPSSLRPRDFNSLWQAVVQVFGLRSVKARHLEHRLGNIDELRSKLLASHLKYHEKNPLLILNITDVRPHPFVSFQKSHKLDSENLATLRNQLTSTAPFSDVISSSDPDRVTKEQEAALCIQRHWHKFGPRIAKRRLFATTKRGRIIVKVQTLVHGASLRVRVLVSHLGVEALLTISALILQVAELQRLVSTKFDTVSSENFEAFDAVLKVVREMEASMATHHKLLSDANLDNMIRANDEKGLKEMLQGELDKMASEEVEVVKLVETLHGFSKDDA